MDMELDRIYNMDCLEGLRGMESGCVDLVVSDPPYEFSTRGGSGGAFGRNKRSYHNELNGIDCGIKEEHLVEMARVCKKVNMYLFGSREQVPQYLNFAIRNDYLYDILCWHKSNPVPMCNNKYLSDTEYIVFMRGKGARVYGTFETKRKWWVTPLNVEDKKKWGHPTIKPLEIVRTLVGNSSVEGGVVLDPFMGSGTTAVAAMMEGRRFVGFEIEGKWHDVACRRVEETRRVLEFGEDLLDENENRLDENENENEDLPLA